MVKFTAIFVNIFYAHIIKDHRNDKDINIIPSPSKTFKLKVGCFLDRNLTRFSLKTRKHMIQKQYLTFERTKHIIGILHANCVGQIPNNFVKNSKIKTSFVPFLITEISYPSISSTIYFFLHNQFDSFDVIM